jgi:hypothetical protein
MFSHHIKSKNVFTSHQKKKNFHITSKTEKKNESVTKQKKQKNIIFDKMNFFALCVKEKYKSIRMFFAHFNLDTRLE